MRIEVKIEPFLKDVIGKPIKINDEHIGDITEYDFSTGNAVAVFDDGKEEVINDLLETTIGISSRKIY